MPLELLIGHPDVCGLPDPQAQDTDTLSRVIESWTRALHLFNNDLLSDASFEVEGHRIPVHTFILRSASCVFETMFSDAWKRGEPIVITDCEYTPFLSLMRWIYTTTLVLETKDQLMDILRLASKYMVHSLIDYVRREGRRSYRWTLLRHAVEHNDTDFQEDVWSSIVKHTSFSIARKDFVTSTPEMIAELVSQPSLRVSEKDLFDACYKWSTAELQRQELEVTNENRRKLMEPFIHQFAFQTMAYKDFAGHACDLLTPEEQALVFRRIAGHSVATPFRKKREQPASRSRSKWQKELKSRLAMKRKLSAHVLDSDDELDDDDE